MTNKDNWNNVQDSFSSPSLLETEDGSEFLEWCSMEGSERINELSRQLRTFFNYKNTIIRLRFSRSQKEANCNEITLVKKQEDDLTTLFLRYTPLMDIIGADEKNIAEKIRNLIQKIRYQPKSLERDLLKNIKELGSELWVRIHALSTLEVHHYPRLLYATIRISKILCSAESVFFWPFSCFYLELKQNYSRLEEEVLGLIHLNEKARFKMKEDKRKVKIVE